MLAINYPNTNAEIYDWVKTHLSHKIVLAPRLKKMLKKCTYDNPKLICQAIELLATKYGGNGTDFQNQLQSLHLQDGSCVTQAHGIPYEIRYRGKKYTLNRHLKKGCDRDPKKCLRIYYCYMPDTNKVLIGVMPEHL